MTNANPSLDPANNDTLLGALNEAFKKFGQRMSVALPVRVIAYSRGGANSPAKVEVEHVISMLNTNGDAIPRGQVASVPVIQIGGGGVILSFNILPGDMGLLIACDRDTSIFVQSGRTAAPNTARTHDFSSSFFIPMVLRGYTINTEDATNAVLQTLDGSLRISMFADKIKITGNTEFSNDVLIDGDLEVSGKATVFGNFACGGNITAAGTITPGVPIPP